MRARPRPAPLLPRLRPAHDRHRHPRRLDRALPRPRGTPLGLTHPRLHPTQSPRPKALQFNAAAPCCRCPAAAAAAATRATGRLRHPRHLRSTLPRTPGSNPRPRTLRRRIRLSAPRRRRHRDHRLARRAHERHLSIRIAPHRPAEFVHGIVVPTAQRDEVVEIGQTTLGPMFHVMDVGELAIGAAGNATPFVPAADLDPLRHRRFPSGPSLVEDGSIGTFDRQRHPGITGQPASNLSRHRTHALELGHPAIDPHQQTEGRMQDSRGRSARLRLRPPPPPPPHRCSITPGMPRSTLGRPMEQLDQDVVKPLVVRNIRTRPTVARPATLRTFVSRRRSIPVPNQDIISRHSTHQSRLRQRIFVTGESHPHRPPGVIESQRPMLELPAGGAGQAPPPSPCATRRDPGPA